MIRLVFLAAALAIADHAAATTLIHIAVANPAGPNLQLSYVEEPLTGRARIFRLPLRDDRATTFELALADHTELLLEHGQLHLPLYVGPGDTLDIAVDAAVGIASVAYTGDGRAENEFLAAFAAAFPAGETVELGGGFLPVRVERSVVAEAAPADVDHFARWVYRDFDARANLIERLAVGVDPELVAAYRTRNRYRTERNKAAYLLHNQAVLTPNELRSAAGRLSVARPDSTGDGRLLADAGFADYLRAYAQILTLPHANRHDERTGEELFAAIGEALPPAYRHFLQAELLVNAFDYLGNPDFGLDHYPAMLRDGAAERYRHRVEEAYGDVLTLAPDALAPNIGMYTAAGAPVSLTDLSGQVVYISFWASWCKPCLTNFERYDAIREQLQGRGVTLLNVSIDDDELAWRRALEQHAPRGLNTRATDLDGVKRAYNLASIPAYHIIDKAGRVVLLPEGPDRDLLASFDEIIAR